MGKSNGNFCRLANVFAFSESSSFNDIVQLQQSGPIRKLTLALDGSAWGPNPSQEPYLIDYALNHLNHIVIVFNKEAGCWKYYKNGLLDSTYTTTWDLPTFTSRDQNYIGSYGSTFNGCDIQILQHLESRAFRNGSGAHIRSRTQLNPATAINSRTQIIPSITHFCIQRLNEQFA